MVDETDIPKVLGLRSEVATVIAELRTHPLDELPTAADRLEASVARPLDDLLAGRANGGASSLRRPERGAVDRRPTDATGEGRDQAPSPSRRAFGPR
jgi:hypothetical protein